MRDCLLEGPLPSFKASADRQKEGGGGGGGIAGHPFLEFWLLYFLHRSSLAGGRWGGFGNSVTIEH